MDSSDQANAGVETFQIEGNWYKGNTHCHTTVSDGLKSPLEAVDWYRNAGYDFLVITDHGCMFEVDHFSTEDLLVIPGVEVDAVDPQHGPFHLVGIGTQQDNELFRENLALEEFVEYFRDESVLTVLAHPYWMGLLPVDDIGFRGLKALEVFNTTCEFHNGKGTSDEFWDEFLGMGMRLWGIAADDTHWKPQRDDPGGGWVMVKAKTPTKEDILKSIESGYFYSTTGPELLNFQIENDIVSVQCSEARIVNFKAQGRHGHTVRASNGKAITEANFTLRGPEEYIRIEVIDFDCRKAWSNPIFLEPEDGS